MTNEELVERLSRVSFDAQADRLELTDHWENMSEYTKETYRVEIRAVLVELAKMGAGELPSTDDIMRAWWSHDGPRGRDSAAIEHGVYNMLCSRVAPILAAKDAELAKLMAHSEHLQRLLNDADATIEELRTKKGSES